MAQKLVYESSLSLAEFGVYDNPTRNDAQGPRSSSQVAPFTTPGPKTPATIDVSDVNAQPDGTSTWLSTFTPERDGPAIPGIRLSSGPINGKWMSAGMSASKCPHIVAGMAIETDFQCSAYTGTGGGKVCIGLWGVNSWPPEVDLFETADPSFQSMFITNHFPAPGQTPPRGQAQIPGIKADFTKRTTLRCELNATGLFYYVNGNQVGSHTAHLPTQPLYWFAQTACTGFPKVPSGPYHVDILGLRAYTL